MSILDIFKKKKEEKQFPPVPKWKPDFKQPLDKIINSIKHYSNGTKDFVVFKNGTVAIVPDNLPENKAIEFAFDSLSSVFGSHPDMKPMEMDDGNILIGYKNDVVNVVISEVVKKHWDDIESNHQGALATSEVLMTPLGNNVFDDFGKKSLFGRCFMFMDAQKPEVYKVIRKAV